MDKPRVLVIETADDEPALLDALVWRLADPALDVGKNTPRDPDVGLVERLKSFVQPGSSPSFERELARHPPDLLVAASPGSARTALRARDRRLTRAPLLVVVPDHAPGGWAGVRAERFATVTEAARAALGLGESQAFVMGPVCDAAFADAEPRERARARLGLSGAIVVVDATRFAVAQLPQLIVQLTLVGSARSILIVDDERRAVVSKLAKEYGLRGKMVQRSHPDAVGFAAGADVLVGRPGFPLSGRALLRGIRAVAPVADVARLGADLSLALAEPPPPAIAAQPLAPLALELARRPPSDAVTITRATAETAADPDSAAEADSDVDERLRSLEVEDELQDLKRRMETDEERRRG